VGENEGGGEGSPCRFSLDRRIVKGVGFIRTGLGNSNTYWEGEHGGHGEEIKTLLNTVKCPNRN